jgi:CRISPR-associated protein Cas2
MSEYIICYDITDPRRLVRLHRYLCRHAMPLQYSVFLFVGDDRQLDRCLRGAAAKIDPTTDDLRAYPLPKRGLKARLGCATLPEGVHWSSLPTTW